MSRILTKSGASLADVYDVEGSVAGIEELNSESVFLTHEMGATILSERLVSETTIFQTGDLLQTVDFEVFEPQPLVHSKIVALTVMTNQASRIGTICVGFTDSVVGLNTNPIYSFETGKGSDFTRVIRTRVDGNLVDIGELVPSNPAIVPVFQCGAAVDVQRLAAIGKTLTFGAGTIQLTIMVTRVFPRLGGVSSRGLPVPSW